MDISSQSISRTHLLWRGMLAISPLSFAVIPWGLLAGSYAIDIGLTPIEAQALSAILFAGAAQLVATGMFDAQVGLWTMLLTTFFITSRHFLYSVSMREKISPLPLRWRLPLGFLLTDELFAVCGHQSKKEFEPWYALGAGLSFYLVWNLASLVGIVAGRQIPNLDQWGLEFAVAATFIAIVIPTIKNIPILVAVVVALVASVLLSYWQIEGSLIIASLLAMVAGYLCEKAGMDNSSSSQTLKSEEGA
ncbi:AzlC family ABC transporter permease [Vibrio aphrogenes]|uniref:AzlC family ABC transporter permease n=1 Tax=Vibrio aphrogenes TaxID=1891186 RepID=UPI000B34EDFE|nr:AzlC family ABC transporter permease [Vibrio aphrogenes]